MQGTIWMFGNDISEIPSGWALCDGNNGTPDLVDEFVYCDNTNIGSVVGQHTLSLGTQHIPSHGHSYTLESDPFTHGHTFNQGENDGSGFDDGNDSTVVHATDGNFGGAGTTLQSVSASHSHNQTVDNAGSGSSIDNRPAFNRVVFIKKL